jgi:CubicO group peptidase (beta-lactamase class C family)
LHLPQLIKEDTSTLLSDSVVSPSVYDPVQIEKLRSVCRQWAEKGGIPFVATIVHKGKIIFHEAFGIDENGAPETTGDRKWMASITKLFSGVLMMQFVDQHIIDLDAPVSRYLPELSGKGIDELTVRHLFTHTTGLDFAGEWASDWNQALENQVAQVLPVVEIGKSFSYNRVGYAVAGKIMERLTGTAVPYLFRDFIFSPLGMTTAFSDNTYGGLFCSTNDLARFGQMLLNKGIYNNKRLFSEESFTKMLPRPLFIGDRQWGVGTSPMGGHGLSDEAFGHGAASGSIFRIDPKNDLIIIAARNTPGKGYEEFANQFIEQCTTLIRNR